MIFRILVLRWCDLVIFWVESIVFLDWRGKSTNTDHRKKYLLSQVAYYSSTKAISSIISYLESTISHQSSSFLTKNCHFALISPTDLSLLLHYLDAYLFFSSRKVNADNFYEIWQNLDQNFFILCLSLKICFPKQYIFKNYYVRWQRHEQYEYYFKGMTAKRRRILFWYHHFLFW